MTDRAAKLLWLYHEQSKKNRTIQGSPPLTFKGKGKDLKNYRIYGNTVNGESVGDRTGNLFDGEIERGSFDGSTGEETNSNIRVRSGKVRLTADNYTINADGVSHGVVYVYALNGDFIRDKSITTWTELPVNFEIDISYDVRFCFRKNDNSTLIPSDIMNIMLNSDSEPLPYEPYGYRVPVSVTNGTDTEITNLYLLEQIKMVGNEAEYVDYKEQKMHRVRKNLLQNTATSQTINGVTFTVNSDGSVTCNGTANASAPSVLYIPFTLPIKLYELSGCPDSGSVSTYRVDIRKDDNSMYKYNGNNVVDNGTGCLFDGGNNQYCIRIAPNYTCDNLTFYPMIRKADISDDTYEPYIENTDLDVTLPALPTLSGTNTLSVGTEIQPSGVEIKGKIKGVTA